MKKKLLLVFMALASIINASAATIVPTISTTGNDVWYMIRVNPRDQGNALRQWLSVDADGRMNYSTFTGDDTQHWKVVENGTGVALVNKAGKYIDTDITTLGTRLNTVDIAPVKPLRIIPATGYPSRFYNNSPTIDVSTLGVFVIDNTSATTVATNNTFTYGATGTFGLTTYSPASGDIYIANQNWGSGNVNQIVVFRTDAEAAADVKANLLTAISTVQTGYNNSAEGVNPGQVSQDDRTNLKDAIDYAQSVYDNPTSTLQDYMTSIVDLNSLFTLFKAQVILPELSTNTDNWFYIQGTRPANTYITAPAAGSAGQVKSLTVIPDDTQLWKLEPVGDGFALKNKATGEYINADLAVQSNGSGTPLTTTATAPINSLRFIASSETTNKSFRFWIENTVGSTPTFRLHAGGSNVMNWTGNANDNSTWLFLDYNAAQKVFLVDQLTSTKAYIATLKVGNNPGQINTATMDEINKVISDAQMVADNELSSVDDYLASKNLVLDAQNNLYKKANYPIISSDVLSIYYTLSGKRPTIPSILANLNTTDTIQYQTLKGEDNELWKVVANGTGVALQNKATGKYLASDSIDGSQLITQTATPIKPLKFIVSNELNAGAFRFFLEEDVAAGIDPTFRLHAGLPLVMNWTGDATDNCTWSIADDTQSIINSFNTLLAAADILYTGTATIEGNSYGQYPTASRSTFEPILTTSKGLNLAALTLADLRTAYTSLNSGYTAFKNSKIGDINLIVSTANTPKWFYIIGSIQGGAQYNKCMAKSGANISAAAKIADNADQLWRFEINPTDGDNSILLINKTANEELIVSGQSAVATLGTGGTYLSVGVHGNGLATKFTYLNGTKEELLHFNGSPLVGWFDNNSTSSGWRIEAATNNTAVKDVTVSKLNIRSNNGIITVDGVDKFEVYSIMGQKVNSKAILSKGIYIVKTDKVAQKYIVR